MNAYCRDADFCTPVIVPEEICLYPYDGQIAVCFITLPVKSQSEDAFF